MELSIKDLELINKHFTDKDKQWILDKIKREIDISNIKENINKLEQYLKDNEDCTNVHRAGILLYGDLRYTFNNRYVEINVKNPLDCEVRIDNYCYSTDSIDDIIRVLPDIHIAIEKGII